MCITELAAAFGQRTKVSESESLPKQRVKAVHTSFCEVYVRSLGTGGLPPPCSALLPRGLLEPCCRNAWPLLSSHRLAQSCAELPLTSGEADSTRLIVGMQAGMSRGQRSDLETFRRQISGRLCLPGGLHINPKDKPR